FMDDYSRMTKVYPMKNDAEFLNVFKKYRQFAQGLSGKLIRRFRTDQMRDFVSKEFEVYLMKNAIWHEKSTTHVHKRNGIVDRYTQSMRYKSRTDLIQTGFPKRFWPKVLKAFVHQISFHQILRRET